jgi:hypothetical protein
VTTDEELTVLETQLRRLKIEYEVFFSNPTKRPPTDVEWRKKSRIREEGYRRPQDALLAVQGVRPDVEAHKPHHNPVYGLSHTAAVAAATAEVPAASQPVTLHSAVDKAEREQVERLFNTLVAAKKKAGEKVSGNLDSFSTFVQKKSEEIRKQYGCQDVEFSVELAGGQVKLKAKAKA